MFNQTVEGQETYTTLIRTKRLELTCVRTQGAHDNRLKCMFRKPKSHSLVSAMKSCNCKL